MITASSKDPGTVDRARADVIQEAHKYLTLARISRMKGDRACAARRLGYVRDFRSLLSFPLLRKV